MISKTYIFAALLFLVGCTSAPIQKSEPKETPKPSNELRVINGQLIGMAGLCQSLYGEGTITLRDGNSSQSGQFELRSKRCTNPGDVDSLSMIVSGPFGITAAKFLGSDKEFHFVNVIENERYNGKPDAKTLEKLTGMKGLSLGLLNDLIYGISPIRLSDSQVEEAKQQVLHNGRERIIFQNPVNNTTEAVTLKSVVNNVKIYSYERWNRVLDTASLSSYKPDLIVTFSGNTVSDEPFPLPMLITATSGTQTLEIEYSKVTGNPSSLTVKIKMPK